MAVAALLASAGFAYGETAPVAPSLSLDPQALHLDEAAAPAGLLTQGLDKIGVGDSLKKAGLSVGGYIDSGYTMNHRNHSQALDTGKVQGTGFNSEHGNHYMLNQVDLFIARDVDLKKFDVGGKIEVLYGTDGSAIHSNGLMLGNENSRDMGDDSLHPQYQFDIEQAYVDVAIPVGNGLKVRAGKFDTVVGYESINPNSNPFYSHSYIFQAEPFTHTGIIGIYQVNDKLTVAGGVSRGWDQALKDNNGAIDGIFQAQYAVTKNWTVALQGTVGPENTQDTAHWRLLPDLTTTYTINDKWSVGAEAIYCYDGGLNNKFGNTFSTADSVRKVDSVGGAAGTYGDIWGAALYVAYKVDDRFTVNFRGEKLHDYSQAFVSTGSSATNWYEATLGVTITPMPKDRLLSGVKIRPEIRYDYNDTMDVYSSGRGPADNFKDQLSYGFDLIVNF